MSRCPKLHFVDGEALVDRHGLGDGGQEAVELGRVGQDPAVQDLRDDGPHPGLLAVDAVEVPARQALALARVGQRLGAVQALGAGRELRVGENLGGLEIDDDAADLVGQGLEGLEVGDHEVVDAH